MPSVGISNECAPREYKKVVSIVASAKDQGRIQDLGAGRGGGISARAWQDTPTTSKGVWGSAVSSPIGVWGSAPAALQILHF